MLYAVSVILYSHSWAYLLFKMFLFLLGARCDTECRAPDLTFVRWCPDSIFGSERVVLTAVCLCGCVRLLFALVCRQINLGMVQVWS